MSCHARTCPDCQASAARAALPEPAIVSDPDRPTWEIYLDGRRFATTQVWERFCDTIDAMMSPEAAKRYGNRDVRYRVLNERRG